MADTKQQSEGRVLLQDGDFVDVVDDAGTVVGSVPKHWGAEELAPGLKKKAGSSAKGSDAKS